MRGSVNGAGTVIKIIIRYSFETSSHISKIFNTASSALKIKLIPSKTNEYTFGVLLLQKIFLGLGQIAIPFGLKESWLCHLLDFLFPLTWCNYIKI